MQAIHRLKNEPDCTVVRAEVNLNYDPKKVKDYEKDAVVYLDQLGLKITARAL